MTLGWHCRTKRVPGYTVVLHRAVAGADTGDHRVDLPLIAIAISGDCSTTVDGWRAETSSRIAWIEPSTVRRRTRIGRSGALLLSILPDPGGADLFASPRVIDDPLVAHDATRAVVEMVGRDSVSSLALRCHVEMLVSRVSSRESRAENCCPEWLTLARDYVHEHYRRPFELEDIATLAGVTVPHFARCFRAHFGVTVGDYVRRLRILWTAEQLSFGRESLAAVSLSAGFFDQSHFTREFRRQLGVTPAGFRRAVASFQSVARISGSR